MKILFTASECVPFCKTGGLADVVGSLAPVLSKKGHDVRVMLPLYSTINEEWIKQLEHVIDFEVDLGWRKQYCGIEKLEKDGVIYYFVDNKYYFSRPYIYGLGGDEYERFGFFCRAILNALPLIDFKPDIIHAHDWQTGYVPALLKIQYEFLPFYSQIATIYTIHNLQYQGIFAIKDVQDVLGLGDSLFTSDKLESYGTANFMKAGLVYSDAITTVSNSYSDEITTAYYGEHMDPLLRARRNDLFGVVNGIDMDIYNPSTDPNIPYHFSSKSISGKTKCKTALQKELGLTVDSKIPMIAMITRLSNQKGLDLVDRVISEIMNLGIQLVVLGMGESRYVNLFSWAEQNYPGKVVARFEMNNELAHKIYAASDMFLMPSLFEPCGLSQLMSLRYGTLPIVRETGGLKDTVEPYNEYENTGTGFSFCNYNAHEMMGTVRYAEHVYYDKKRDWNKMVERAMSVDFSWKTSAKKYQQLYDDLIG